MFDSSLDSLSVKDSYGTPNMALPLLAFNSSNSNAIATTWGFDLLLEKQIDINNEDRLYKVEAPVEFDPY